MSAALVSAMLLAGCVNKTAKSEDSAQPQSMVPDAPKDDGQGVGKYKNVTVGALDVKSAGSGQALFEAKCTACHKTTDQKLIGPGLKGVTQRRQAAWILNMMTNPVSMTQIDPIAKELLATYKTQMTFQDVNDEQAMQILEFLRKNDGGGPAEAAK